MALKNDLKWKCDKLTIITSETMINPLDFRIYIVDHWKDITKEMKNSTILFLGGVHGSESGKLGEKDDITNYEKQVCT